MGHGTSIPGNIVGGPTTYAKQYFHRAINAIFRKIGKLASEEVILELVCHDGCMDLGKSTKRENS